MTRAVPRTQAVTTARVRAADATKLAAKERSAAHAAASEAAEKRSAWSHATTEHGAICSAFGLPHTVEELAQVRQATAEAGSACRRLSDLLTDLGKLVIAHKEAVGRAGDRTTEREEAEARAAGEWAV